MAAKVSRLAEVRWKKMRSGHARTLQELERARALHPSAGAVVTAKPKLRNVKVVPANPDSAA